MMAVMNSAPSFSSGFSSRVVKAHRVGFDVLLELLLALLLLLL